MNAVTQIVFFNDTNENFFSEGPTRLLHTIAETGSLQRAAMAIEMAYSKAFCLIQTAAEAV
jgi:molybdenum-dependent DNA-binding transcriptional regulator ModE